MTLQQLFLFSCYSINYWQKKHFFYCNLMGYILALTYLKRTIKQTSIYVTVNILNTHELVIKQLVT